MWMATADCSIRSRFEGDEDRTAPAFDKAQAEMIGRQFSNAYGEIAFGRAVEDGAAKAERFQQLVEAHGNACGHVAIGLRHFARRDHVVGRQRQVAAEIECLTARASAQTCQPELLRELRRCATAAPKAVLQAGMLVVNVAQDSNLPLERRALITHCRGMRWIER